MKLFKMSVVLFRRLSDSQVINKLKNTMKSKGSLDRQTMMEVFQYLVTMWQFQHAYPAASLRNFTVYDFVNREQTENDGPEKIKILIRDDKKFDYQTTNAYYFSEWECQLMQYYFTHVRTHWVIKAKPSQLNVYLQFYDNNEKKTRRYVERTQRFMVNSTGQTISINYSRVNHSWQKTLDISKKDRINTRHRCQLPTRLDDDEMDDETQAEAAPQAEKEELTTEELTTEEPTTTREVNNSTVQASGEEATEAAMTGEEIVTGGEEDAMTGEEVETEEEATAEEEAATDEEATAEEEAAADEQAMTEEEAVTDEHAMTGEEAVVTEEEAVTGEEAEKKPGEAKKSKLVYDVFEVHKHFPLPITTDVNIPSKTRIARFLSDNPSLVRCPERQSSEAWAKMAEKAVNSVWYRCYQKRMDLRVETFTREAVGKHRECPTASQISNQANLNKWGKNSKKLYDLVKGRWKQRPDATFDPSSSSRDETRIPMSKDYAKSKPMRIAIHGMTKSQEWENLQIVENVIEDGMSIGRGVVTTAKIPAGALFLDYHHTSRHNWKKKEANARIEKEAKNNSKSTLGNYIIFSMYGPEVYNATDEFCQCHPQMRTMGRLPRKTIIHQKRDFRSIFLCTLF